MFLVARQRLDSSSKNVHISPDRVSSKIEVAILLQSKEKKGRENVKTGKSSSKSTYFFSCGLHFHQDCKGSQASICERIKACQVFCVFMLNDPFIFGPELLMLERASLELLASVEKVHESTLHFAHDEVWPRPLVN